MAGAMMDTILGRRIILNPYLELDVIYLHPATAIAIEREAEESTENSHRIPADFHEAMKCHR